MALLLVGGRPALAAPEPDDVAAALAETQVRGTVESIAAILAGVNCDAGSERATTRLCALGPAAVPSVFAVLAHGRVAEDGDLNETQEGALVASLRRFSGGPLFEFLSETIPWSEDARIRVTGLRVLRDTARGDQVPLILASALPPGAEGQAVLELAQPIDSGLREALEQTLRRDPAAFDAVGRAWSGLAPALEPAVVGAVGRAGTSRALDLLQRLLASDPGAAPLVTLQVARLAGLASPQQASHLAPLVRGQLFAEQETTRRVACVAVGRLRDTGSVPALVAMASEEAHGARANALWALREITGLRLRDDPVCWTEWLERERAWFAREGARVTRDLASMDRATAATALRLAAARPLHRDVLAPAIEDVLRSGDAGFRAQACRALASLGARTSHGTLIDLLDDPQPEVVSAAHAALRALFKRDLPPNATAWRDAAVAAD